MKGLTKNYINFINLFRQEIFNVVNMEVTSIDVDSSPLNCGIKFTMHNLANNKRYFFKIDGSIIDEINDQKQNISVVCACVGHIRAYVYHDSEDDSPKTKFNNFIPKVPEKILNDALL